jgi:hypothetical protein
MGQLSTTDVAIEDERVMIVENENFEILPDP